MKPNQYFLFKFVKVDYPRLIGFKAAFYPNPVAVARQGPEALQRFPLEGNLD